ncbi:Hypothetical_protein [Hexamita inflata]|uniref:Hypothetical_protein n=1 Tax=Hexamita inflata TaxID=28002 RepID=A0AA86Q0V5_9EUKA|nr:Hypothetical protein HINF_LOCUS36161 [Hexamita inflata]
MLSVQPSEVSADTRLLTFQSNSSSFIVLRVRISDSAPFDTEQDTYLIKPNASIGLDLRPALPKSDFDYSAMSITRFSQSQAIKVAYTETAREPLNLKKCLFEAKNASQLFKLEIPFQLQSIDCSEPRFRSSEQKSPLGKPSSFLQCDSFLNSEPTFQTRNEEKGNEPEIPQTCCNLHDKVADLDPHILVEGTPKIILEHNQAQENNNEDQIKEKQNEVKDAQLEDDQKILFELIEKEQTQKPTQLKAVTQPSSEPLPNNEPEQIKTSNVQNSSTQSSEPLQKQFSQINFKQVDCAFSSDEEPQTENIQNTPIMGTFKGESASSAQVKVERDIGHKQDYFESEKDLKQNDQKLLKLEKDVVEKENKEPEDKIVFDEQANTLMANSVVNMQTKNKETQPNEIKFEEKENNTNSSVTELKTKKNLSQMTFQDTSQEDYAKISAECTKVNNELTQTFEKLQKEIQKIETSVEQTKHQTNQKYIDLIVALAIILMILF